MLIFLYLFIAGLIGGFIAGLVGIGGGIVYVFIIPSALRLIGIPEAEMPQYTIANSIFAILFASASANYMHMKLKIFYRKEVLIISGSAIICSLLVLNYIVNQAWYSIEVFNILIIIILTQMFYTTIRSAKKVDIIPLDSLKKWKLSAIGLAGGSIAALSGLGGGIVIIPLLNAMMKVDIRRASSISSGVIMVTAFFMTIFSLFETPIHEHHVYNLGYIIFPIAVTISLGVIIASPIGVKVSRNMSLTKISYIYASFLIIVILKKIIEIIKTTTF